MSTSIMDAAARHAWGGVEIGASPLVPLLCNADVREDFARTASPEYRRPLEYTLADMEREGAEAENALSLMKMWGLELPREVVDGTEV